MGVKKKFSLGRLGLFVVLMMLTINIAFRMDVSAAVLTEQSLQGVSISEQSESFLGQNEMKSVAGSNEEEKLEAELEVAGYYSQIYKVIFFVFAVVIVLAILGVFGSIMKRSIRKQAARDREEMIMARAIASARKMSQQNNESAGQKQHHYLQSHQNKALDLVKNPDEIKVDEELPDYMYPQNAKIVQPLKKKKEEFPFQYQSDISVYGGPLTEEQMIEEDRFCVIEA